MQSLEYKQEKINENVNSNTAQLTVGTKAAAPTQQIAKKKLDNNCKVR